MSDHLNPRLGSLKRVDNQMGLLSALLDKNEHKSMPKWICLFSLGFWTRYWTNWTDKISFRSKLNFKRFLPFSGTVEESGLGVKLSKRKLLTSQTIVWETVMSVNNYNSFSDCSTAIVSWVFCSDLEKLLFRIKLNSYHEHCGCVVFSCLLATFYLFCRCERLAHWFYIPNIHVVSVYTITLKQTLTDQKCCQ